MAEIRERLEKVRDRIRGAALRSGRLPEAVRLVAVSKKAPLSALREALEAGAEVFGESVVQEALPKLEALDGEKCRWHFVGHLQTNKVRQAAGRFDLIHSVDSLRLAEALHERCGRQGIRQRVLLQVNISGEAGKFGVPALEAEGALRHISRLGGLEVVGLMTIPPWDEDPQKSRPVYRRLKALADSLAGQGIEGVGLNELSMGMSNDFEVAVEEGATWVRVGAAIFGPRET